MELKDIIRTNRKLLGLTQTELGARLGVKKNAVSKWETGRVEDIPTSKLKAMAKLFGLEMSELLGEREINTDELNELINRLPEDKKQALYQYALFLLQQDG